MLVSIPLRIQSDLIQAVVEGCLLEVKPHLTVCRISGNIMHARVFLKEDSNLLLSFCSLGRTEVLPVL